MKKKTSIYGTAFLVLIALLFIPVCYSSKKAKANNIGADQACEGERYGLELVNGYPACCVHFDDGRTEVHICEKNFPDEFFRSYIQFVQYGGARVYGNMTIPFDKLTGITELPIRQQGHELYMTTLKGIEFLPALESLNCSGHVLTEIDLSHNPKLKFIDCAGNYLTSIDFSLTPQLEEIDCSANQLTSLDLSSNTKLVKLNVSNNPLSALQIESCTDLKTLDVSNTEIKIITLGSGAKLTDYTAGKYVWRQTDGHAESVDSVYGQDELPYWTYEYNEDLTLRYATEDRGWDGKTGYDYENGQVVRETSLASGDGSGTVKEYIRDEQGRIIHASNTRTYIGEVQDVLEKQYSFDDSGKLRWIKFVYTDMDGSHDNGEAELNCIYQSLNGGWTVEYQLNWITYSSFLDSYHNASFDPDPESWTNGRSRIIRENFDKEGRLLRREWDDGDYTVWEYDSEGCMIKKERANGRATTYEYNELGQLLSESNGSSVYTYIYGAKNQCTAERCLGEKGISYVVYLSRSYDKYGHLVQFIGNYNGGSINGEYNWVYLPVPGSEQPVLSYKDEKEAGNLDALLEADPAIYNNDLAIIAAKLSLKTYDNNSANDDSVRDCLIYDLGFNSASHAKFYSNNYGGSLAYTIAVKDCPTDDADKILVIVCRGSRTPYELIRDATASFRSIYQERYPIYDIVQDFYDDIDEGLDNVLEMDNRYKVLVTGHSLGGAAANLVAASLTDDGLPRFRSTCPSVFCYTFGAINSIDTSTTISEGYENIHNVYNLRDTFSPKHYGKRQYMLTGMGSGVGKFGHLEIYSHEHRTIGDQMKSTVTQMYDAVNHGMAKYLQDLEELYVVSVPNCGTGFRCRSIIGCPVDVDVYCEGNLVGRVVNNVVDQSMTSLDIYVEDDVKIIYYPDDKVYDLQLKAYDEGEMLYYTEDLQNAGESKMITGVELTNGKEFSSQIGGNIEASGVKLYVVNDDGEVLTEVLEDGTETQIEYTVTVIDGIATPGKAKAGDTVTITADTKSGYTFKEWSVTGNVTLANKTDSTTTFTMPAGDVTLTVTYTKDADPTPGVPVQTEKTEQTGDTEQTGNAGRTDPAPTETANTGTVDHQNGISWTVMIIAAVLIAFGILCPVIVLLKRQSNDR